LPKDALTNALKAISKRLTKPENARSNAMIASVSRKRSRASAN
jgi:hypothetical protein